MKKIWNDCPAALFIFFICLYFSIGASEFVNYINCEDNKNITFILTTPKSGSNVITGCLSALTRKPISWFSWGGSIQRDHISYNRLGLSMISDTPLLYRTHYDFVQLMQVPSELNKLIFVTRNPKELLYRSFFLTNPSSDMPDDQFIEAFFKNHLNSFEVYEAWCPHTRRIVFYEDFIINQNEILLELLQFMEETPTFLEDFLNNREEYLSRFLKSYTTQHTPTLGGSSSKEGPKAIFYTRNISSEQLRLIDDYIKREAPNIWENYLNRFETK